MICSKQFTDLNLRLFAHSVKSCCKTNETNFTLEDIKKYGSKVFLKQKELAQRRHEHLWQDALPSACNFCAQTEPNSMRKFWNKWQEPTHDKQRIEIEEKDHLSYFEIVSSTACDLACIYCNAENSSMWAKEMDVPILKTDPEWKSALISAFYQYLEEKNYNDLTEGIGFSFSGGEPTYNNETFEVIENIVGIVSSKIDTIDIHLTTNMNTKAKQMDKFVALVNKYPNVKWVFNASIDDVFSKNDAIRYHSKFETCLDNINKLRNTSAFFVLMPSINVFSLPNTIEYINFFVDLLGGENYGKSWCFATNVVYGPEYLSPFMLGRKYKRLLDEAIEISKNINPNASLDYDSIHWIKHLENIKNNLGMYNSKDNWIKLKYFLEGTRERRKVDIADIFPHVREKIDLLENDDVAYKSR